MDQLRKALGWLKRQHFWVLCALVAIVAVALWWRAAAAMRQEYTANSGAIEGEFTKMQGLKNQAFHPNDVVNTRQEEENKKQSDEVGKTWQQLYDRQREKVLEWPAALSQEFRDYVAKKRFEDAIPPHLRNNYQNYAERYFPELPKIVGARELEAVDNGGGAFGGRGGMEGGGRYGGRGGMEGAAMMTPEGEDADKYVCEWLDQQVVRDELNFPNRPNSIRIWVTQEDLWVYKTLLNIIKNTNDAVGATRKSNAAVKTIFSLEVGQRAAPYSRNPNHVYRLPSAAPSADMMLGAAPGMEGTMGAEAGMSPEGSGRYSDERGGTPFSSMGGDSRMGGEAQMTEAQERGFLLNRRYLGQDGKPITVAGGELAMAGGEMAAAADPAADPAAAAAPAASGDPSEFGVEYKRLPVRMCLRMDQRMLTFLISECANQPLQVEVQEVRINPADFASGGGGGGFLGGGGGRYEGGGAFGGGAAPPFPDRTGIQTFSAQPNLVNVVVQGVIYIFNPPDMSKLKPAEQATEPLANM